MHTEMMADLAVVHQKWQQKWQRRFDALPLATMKTTAAASKAKKRKTSSESNRGDNADDDGDDVDGDGDGDDDGDGDGDDDDGDGDGDDEQQAQQTVNDAIRASLKTVLGEMQRSPKQPNGHRAETRFRETATRLVERCANPLITKKNLGVFLHKNKITLRGRNKNRKYDLQSLLVQPAFK
jgi:hypothetical protein